MIASLIAAAAMLLGLVLTALVSNRTRRRLTDRLDAARRDLEKLQLAFGRFTPERLVDRIAESGTNLQGEKRDVTVLFCDIRGFTRLSEELAPSVLLEVLGRYFSAMSAAVSDHHGQVTRFVGDELMALFGALERNPWQIRDSVLAALAMRSALQQYNIDLAAEGLPEISMGVGIHHGEVIAGLIGTEDLLQFDVYGDDVNIASRVQTLTRTFETDLLVTDAVQSHVEDLFEMQPMPPTTVRGKSSPIRTYAVVGEKAV